MKMHWCEMRVSLKSQFSPVLNSYFRHIQSLPKRKMWRITTNHISKGTNLIEYKNFDFENSL